MDAQGRLKTTAKVWWCILLAGGFGAGEACGGEEAKKETTVCEGCVESVSIDGVTFAFSEPRPVGTYANGDYWVLAPVTLTAVEPAAELSVIEGSADLCDGFSAGDARCSDECAVIAPADHTARCNAQNRCFCERARNGWEVNPVHPNGQAFDDRAGGFDSTLMPSLPYTAAADQSIVKTVSRNPEESDPRPSLSRAAVLTVVSDEPPGAGAEVFRPPYVGDEKTLYRVDALQTDLLPTLAPVEETPSLEWVYERFRPLQLDHKGGRANRYLHPAEHMPNYGCDIGRDIGDGALRLMLDDAVEAKREALIVFVQMGIDLYHAVLSGQTWPAGGGHQTGRKLGLVFASVLLDDPAMQAVAADSDFFEEDTGVYRSGAAGVPLYGYDIFYWSEEAYWSRLVEESGNKAHRDPYEMIDGGWLDGGNYQGIVSPTWKSEALALHLMPALRSVWDDADFVEYVDRWVNLGFWTQPDPCAPENGVWEDYGAAYGPDGNGGCIPDANDSDGVGRFVDVHGTGADGPNRRSAFAGHLWDAYRGPSCYDGLCEADETAQSCAYDCAP
jgi:hypothetical protein